MNFLNSRRPQGLVSGRAAVAHLGRGTVPAQPPVSARAQVGRLGPPTALNRAAFGGSARGEEVALDYVFDFDQSEQVLYAGSFPFPRRYFLLHFWRNAKDGFMKMLGYEFEGSWRDPNHCHYPSTRRYVPRTWLEQANAPHSPSDGGLADTTGLPPRRAPIARLPSRQVLVELEPGVFELPPPPAGLALHRMLISDNFPVRRKTIAPPVRRTPPPPLNTRFQKTLIFVGMSAHFNNPMQAERELLKVLKVLRLFPKIHLTIEGNFCYPFAPPGTFGFGPKARADQDARFFQPIVTRWPTETESYSSTGELMERRAQTIRQYLLRNGIPASRITARRGQYTPGDNQRSVTIIFSN